MLDVARRIQRSAAAKMTQGKQAVVGVVLILVTLALLHWRRTAIFESEPIKTVNHFGKPHNCRKDSTLCGIDTKSLDSSNKLSNMTIDELKTVFHRLITPVKGGAGECSETAVFGKSGEGGYTVCMTPQFKPQPGNCLVYSFGINNEWSLDEAMAKYGCEVHSFDPSLGLSDHLHAPNVHFHNLGLWGDEFVDGHKWNLLSLSKIRQRLGHTKRPISVLKIDAEGAEWPFLRDVTTNDQTLYSDVGQVLTEIHTPRPASTNLNKTDLFEMIYYFDRLLDSSSNGYGFTIHRNDPKNWCCEMFAPLMPPGIVEQCCYEIFLLNTRYNRP